MGTQRNAVEWEFLLDQRQLDRGLKSSQRGFDKTRGKSDTLEKAMGRLKGAVVGLGLAFGANEIIGFGQDAIQSASDYAESVNAVEVSYGDAAVGVQQFGLTAATEIGLSQTAVNDLAVQFAGFAENVAGDKSVQDTFADYTTRAADFASVMNLEATDAVRIFQSTLSGESEPIRKFGIDMSAAAVAAHAAAVGIADIDTKMTEAEKQQARYSLLMQETEQFAGDFANTSDELANQQRILNAEWENGKVALGEELLPAMVTAVGVGRGLIGSVDAIGNAWAKAQYKLLPFADDVLAASGGQIDLAASYRGTGEMLFLLNRELRFAKLRMQDGMSPTAAATKAFIGLSDANALTGVNVAKVRKELFLSDDQFLESARQVLFFADQEGFATGETKELEDAVSLLAEKMDRELVARTEDSAEAARDLAYETMQTARAQEDALQTTEALNEALLGGLDPVSKAIGKYATLQETLARVDEDGERTAEELLDVAEATLDVAGAFNDLSADDINQAVDSLSTALGISETAARDLLEELGLLDGKTISTKVLLDFVGSIGGRKVTTTVGMRADGGPVSAGKPYIVGEEGPELIVPNAGGTVIPNGGSGGSRGSSSGGGATINITVNALDPDAAAVAVVDAIRSYQDRYGEI